MAVTPVTTAPPHSDLLLMLLADARLPVAGHTQSGTLEGAVMAGVGADEVPAYVRARLLGPARVEAGTAVAARRAVLDGADLDGVAAAWAARTPAPALRAAARLQGRALQRLAARLWPATTPLLADVAEPPRAVVLGTVAAVVDLGADAVARLVAYDDVQTVCAAALKLIPLDPAVVTSWVVDALPHVEAAALAVSDIKDPTEIPAVSVPQIEAWAQAHARTTRRLFRA